MACSANTVFNGGLEVIPARHFAGIDPGEFAVKLKELA